MKNAEAIEFLKNMIDRESVGFVCPQGSGDVAILQYHVEALNMAIAALEKQEGKKPVAVSAKSTWVKCPVCGSTDIDEYCEKCGQRIDWSDEH